MEKIYVVTRGEYSDYGICAMFTEKKLAQAFIDSFKIDGYGGFNDIEEYELNPYKNDLKAGRKAYSLRMNVEGNTTDVEQADSTYGFNSSIGISFTHNKEWMNVFCFAKDETHAIKIANEKRVQYIAANAWGKRL
jgi:hypothetical protein